MAEQDAIQRMQIWWSGLDPTTKTMFEQLYERDRDGVLAVVSSGEVPARDGTLASFLEVDNIFAALDNIPSIQPVGELTVDPAGPDANQAFQLSWSETNSSKVECPAYTDLVQVFDMNSAVVSEQSIDRPALAAGESAQVSAQVAGVPTGSYTVYVTSNAGGIDSGSGQPTAQGFKGYSNVLLGVGGVDMTRPDSPERADSQNVNEAYQLLYSAYNSSRQDALRATVQALYAFAGVVDPGGVVSDEENYRNDLMVQTLQRAQLLEGVIGQVDLDAAGADEAFREELMAALQAIYPVTVDPGKLRENANDIQQAIVAIGRNSFRI